MEILVLILAIVTTILATVGLLRVMRRLPIAAKLKETNDVAGYYITIIGTIYAVIMAFMLFAVWTRFDAAVDTVDQEANALIDIFRLANTLPERTRSQVKQTARDYASSAVSDEWPAMATHRSSPTTRALYEQLWQILTAFQPRTPHDQIVFDHLLTRLSDLAGYRRVRLLKSRSGLPAILWALLILGGIGTVAFSFLFGVERFALHAFKASTLAVTILLVLFAISEIDGPFQGSVHVTPDAFKQAVSFFDQRNMQEPGRKNL